MKKRNLLTVSIVILLALALGMGTLAYFTKDFTSNDNVVRAASFEVGDNGTLSEDHIFDLGDDPIYPGREMDVYDFEIHKNNTEVPVVYDLTVTGLDPLFEGDTPVELTLLRKVGEEWVEYDGRLENPEDIENFKINLKWNHTDHDIDYQGKTGKININVVATQVDEELPPVDPDAPFVDNIVYKKTNHPNPHQYGIGNFGNLPGDYYMVFANTKSGERIGPEYTKAAPVKGFAKWITLKVEPEEIRDFDVIIKTKDKYNNYTDVLELYNIPFEYND